jgi:hypothetical protein
MRLSYEAPCPRHQPFTCGKRVLRSRRALAETNESDGASPYRAYGPLEGGEMPRPDNWLSSLSLATAGLATF